MSDLVHDLLKTYYGFGSKNKEKINDQSSSKTICDKLSENNDVEIENLHLANESSDVTSEEVSCTYQSFEANAIGNSIENNTQIIRSWRAINDDNDPDYSDNDFKDDDLNIDVQDISECINQCDVDDTALGLVKLGIATLDIRQDITKTRHSIVGFDDAHPDSSSEKSSRSARKYTINKKLPLINKKKSPEPKEFLPPIVKSTSPSLKVPIYNELYCDMANAAIDVFPKDILDKIQDVKMIYLENNNLKELPGEIFIKLKNLQWLDVRNNQLKTLPSSINNHPCLETILLQGNIIEKLPLELCSIPSLKSIHLANNPLVFPDMDVVALGFKAIIEFLRNEYNKKYPDKIINPPEENMSTMTILCHEPPSKTSLKRPKLISDSDQTCKTLKKISVRERSKNYKPSNRCEDNEDNQMLVEKLSKMSKLRESLIKQDRILQKVKDKGALKHWRQNRRSLGKSLRRADERHKNSPFEIRDIFQNQGLRDYNPVNPEFVEKMKTLAINKRMSSINNSMRQLNIKEKTEIHDPMIKLNQLKDDIKKITKLKQEIIELKKENNTSLSLYETDN